MKKDILLNQRRSQKGEGENMFLEYNCPIIHIAEKHWEACTTEIELFEQLLGA